MKDFSFDFKDVILVASFVRVSTAAPIFQRENVVVAVHQLNVSISFKGHNVLDVNCSLPSYIIRRIEVYNSSQTGL